MSGQWVVFLYYFIAVVFLGEMFLLWCSSEPVGFVASVLCRSGHIFTSDGCHPFRAVSTGDFILTSLFLALFRYLPFP